MKFLMLGEKWWIRYPALLAIDLIILTLLLPFHVKDAPHGSFRDFVNALISGISVVTVIMLNIAWGDYLRKAKDEEQVPVERNVR